MDQLRMTANEPDYPIKNDIDVPAKVQEAWQRSLDVLAVVIGVPVAVIMRVHPQEIEVFARSSNEENPYEKGQMMPLGSGLYCEAVMRDRAELLVPNALADPDWQQNPDIDFGMIAYLGLPLCWPDGEIFGTICVLDRAENHFSTTQRELLAEFQNLVQLHLQIIQDSHDEAVEAKAALRSSNERLEASDARYGALYADAPVAHINISSADGRIQNCNRAAADLTGYEVEELRSINARDLYADIQGGREHAYRIFQRLQNGELVRGEDVQLVRKDGSIRWVSVSVNPVRDDTGAVCEGRIVLTDVTDLKGAEQALRNSRDLLQTIVENLPVRVFWKDRQFRYIGCNTLFAQDAGLSGPEDLIGKDDFQMGWREQADLYRADDAMVMEGGKSKLGYVEPQRTPAGNLLWLRTSKVPLRDSAGDIVGMIGVYEDITEQKQAESALINLNRALSALSDGNRLLVHANDEKTLMRDMCRTIVDKGGYRLAWIGFAEHDEKKSVRPVAHEGFEEGYLESLNITWGDDEHGRGPTGRAIRLGTPQLSEDIATDAQFMPWRHQAQQRGYASSLALPMKDRNGTVFAAMNIYADAPQAFDKQEIALLQQLADDLAYGITTRRLRGERDALRRESLKHALARRSALFETIHAIALTVEKRDPYTAGHQRHVANLSAAIARRLGWTDDRIEGLLLGATIHDIGKIYIPAEILNRPGKLNEHEVGLIQTHTEVGYEIIANVQFPWPVADMIRQHHERLDGSGYPRGLKGEEIIEEARIIAVADVVEAITSHRPYRPALGIDVGIEEIRKGRGTVYDPAVVDACIAIIGGGEFDWDHANGRVFSEAVEVAIDSGDLGA
jgi:PAS domain S-box-containing protein/putative nucleotidyltransferase with HDIG domain